ncbi:TetR/AcrR family transcriptional regulator [Tsukamurella ocularis]|uniref:TetR/AcrR family transcriptional regulator n=1 Tax=Tsukamurella ocularis TaxID=1970234 RepID=UPI002169BBC6|nr:TetR/AcrR family transcriptional regulator [Tsukamurella ocularis]MCS3781826.1 AcrR family transcriptional regulator [Tsukamurella ocularis]MCS3788320.1 AcrR family transcriptional regulator [Tsukamurella ocularis]MCS3852040.1 AcrR family transcriptional regulator [Tsukamurella ocularis]
MARHPAIRQGGAMNSRDDLIRATIALMRDHGVAGTGVADIIEGSGRSRRTVYMNFPGGKSELVDTATRTAGRYIAGLIEAAIAKSTGRTDMLEQVGAAWRQVLVSSGFRSGCPIVAAALGRADSGPAADAAGEAFETWIALLANRFEEDGGGARAARRAATTIIAAIEGAVIMSSATRSTQPLDDVEASLLAMYGDR